MSVLGSMRTNTKQILLLNFANDIIYYGLGKTSEDFKWYCYDVIKRVKKYISKQVRFSIMKCFLFDYDKFSKFI